MGSLDGKVALVTGAGRGIGRATALELAKCGATVAAAARSRGELDETVNLVRGQGGRAAAFPVDLAEDGATRSLVSAVERELAPVDILVNNAAVVGPFGANWELDADAWVRAVQVNLTAPFLLVHVTLPGMIAAGWGRIVNVSSGAAQSPRPRFGAYSPTKAALDMLTRQLALELEGTDVAVTTVYPGTVDTVMQSDIRAQREDLIGEENSRIFHNFHSSGALRSPQQPAQLIAAVVTMEPPANGAIISIGSEEAQSLIRDWAIA